MNKKDKEQTSSDLSLIQNKIIDDELNIIHLSAIPRVSYHIILRQPYSLRSMEKDEKQTIESKSGIFHGWVTTTL